jgi:hypothetical protein
MEITKSNKDVVSSREMMKEEKKPIDQKVLDEIIEAIGKIKHGQVVITVYDSKVVQIEETKKKRFN